MRIAKFYAQKSLSDARKLLVAQRDSAIIDRGSRERWPLDRAPRAHLAVGSRQEIGEDRRHKSAARRASPGDAAGVSQRGPRRGGYLQPADHWATPVACPGSGAAPDREPCPSGCGLRLVGGDARGCAPSRALHGARTGEGGVPPGRCRRWGQAHPLGSQGAGDGSTRGVSSARKGALAPLCFRANARSAFVRGGRQRERVALVARARAVRIS